MSWFIGCKSDSPANVSMIERCISSIRAYHPFDEIFCVDSGSSNKSYFPLVKAFGAEVLDINNKNYTCGMIWYAFENFKRPFYYFFHDSCEFYDNLHDLHRYSAASVRYFSPCWDAQEQIDWLKEQFAIHTPYEFQSEFTGLFGPMLCCSIEVLQLLKNKGFDKIIPTNKIQMKAKERAWGMVLGLEGFDIKRNSIQGDYFGKINESRMKKFFPGRN